MSFFLPILFFSFFPFFSFFSVFPVFIVLCQCITIYKHALFDEGLCKVLIPNLLTFHDLENSLVWHWPGTEGAGLQGCELYHVL